MEKLIFDLKNKLASIRKERQECRTGVKVIEEQIKNLYELESFTEETIDRVQELIDRDTQDTASANI